MRKRAEFFPFVLMSCGLLLFYFFQSIYEDAAKVWVLAKLGEYGYGPDAANVMSGFAQIVPAVGAVALIIWFLYWFIRHELEKKDLAFNRVLETPSGEFGHYTACISVRNTSDTAKLKDCRCEILELRDEGGSLVSSRIGLRTIAQETKGTQGRFNLDQGSVKEIPLFEIDQSRDEGLTVVNANGWDLTFGHGIYTARVNAYGDAGKADEITVRLNSRNCVFELLSETEAKNLSNEISSSSVRRHRSEAYPDR